MADDGLDDGPDKASLAKSKRIQRLLARATAQSVRAQGRQIQAVTKIGRQTKAAARAGERLAKALDRALRAGKPNVRNAPSVRMTAPDTGGRSFHFAHSTVTVSDLPSGGLSRFNKDKKGAAGGGGKAAGDGTPSSDAASGGGRRKAQATRGSAHMAYIERGDAIERAPLARVPEEGRGIGEGRDGSSMDDLAPDVAKAIAGEAAERDAGAVPGSDLSGVAFDESLDVPLGGRRRRTAAERALDEELGVSRLEGAIGPDAMQAYAERAGALEVRGRDAANAGSKAPEVAFSFGTIGETPEERLAFWDLVETHAERSNAALQHRLILELPHEVSPETRLAIVKGFTKRFEDQSIPDWAVLHAPTSKNDARNFHAHVVFLTRPAKIIMHPEGGIDDGRLEDGKPRPLVPTWDFAAVTFLPDKFGNRPRRYPFRQDATERDRMVIRERERFAKVANEELAKAGASIRYDHRSYKAMGLPVEALGSLSQKVADQARKAKRATPQTGFTKRVTYADLKRAARQKADAMASVSALEAALPSRRLTARSVLARISEFAKLEYRFSSTAKRQPEKILDLKRKSLVVQKRRLVAAVNGEVERVQVERVVQSTDPAFFSKLHENISVKARAAKSKARSAADGSVDPADFAAAQRASLPDLPDVHLLHREARVELAAVIADTERRDRRFRLMLGDLRASMRRLRTALSPAVSVQGPGNVIEAAIDRPHAVILEREAERVDMLSRQRERQREAEAAPPRPAGARKAAKQEANKEAKKEASDRPGPAGSETPPPAGDPAKGEARRPPRPQRKLFYIVDDPTYVPPAGPYPIPFIRPTSKFMYDLQAGLMAAVDPKDPVGSVDRWLKATVRAFSEADGARVAARASAAAKGAAPGGDGVSPPPVAPGAASASSPGARPSTRARPLAGFENEAAAPLDPVQLSRDPSDQKVAFPARAEPDFSGLPGYDAVVAPPSTTAPAATHQEPSRAAVGRSGADLPDTTSEGGTANTPSRSVDAIDPAQQPGSQKAPPAGSETEADAAEAEREKRRKRRKALLAQGKGKGRGR